MQSDDVKEIAPSAQIGGMLSVPGDKSISQRIAMLAGLADGCTEVRGFLRSGDCLNTLAAVGQLGAQIEDDGETIRITGTGGRFRAPDGALDMGNSGTGMRLLTGLLAGQDFECELTGDASLLSRPMKRLQEPLEAMGASVQLLGEDGRGPIRIRGARLKGMRHVQTVASAQVKSCILFAGLYAAGETVVVEPGPSRDHTERMLADLGCELTVDGDTIRLNPKDEVPRLTAGSFVVPGDFSSAAFWLVAGAIAPAGSRLEIRNVGLNPRRAGLIDVLRRMGAQIDVTVRSDADESYGDICVTAGPLVATDVAGDEFPIVQDEIPIFAVAAAFAEGTSHVRDAAELRVKESDRIEAMVDCLSRAGVSIEGTADGMTITGASSVPGACEIDSRGDHRIAMAMAILALRAEAPVCVRNVACVDTSYPSFWDHLASVSHAAEAE